VFPISRDPPEGGTALQIVEDEDSFTFPISRDPPEGGTFWFGVSTDSGHYVSNF